MGQVVEPLIYGHSTGLSPIAVIVATAFWALLWGPVGLLMATPLTVCLVVIGRHVEALAFLDVILGDRPPLVPAETFYQRALEGKRHGPAAGGRGTRSLPARWPSTTTGSRCAGLALAQGDLARDALAFERLEAIHAQIGVLLALAGPHAAAAPPSGAAVRRRRGAAEGAIALHPGPRPAGRSRRRRWRCRCCGSAGFGARTEPNLVLGHAGRRPALLGGTRLCCLSVLEEGSSASGIRYFVRRIQKRMPGAAVVVCLWHADGTRRADGIAQP